MVRKLTSTHPLVLVLCLGVAGTARAAPEEDEQEGEEAGATDDASDASTTEAGTDTAPPSEEVPSPDEPGATDAAASDAMERIEELERRISELEASDAFSGTSRGRRLIAEEPEEVPLPIRAHIEPLGVNLSVFGAIWIDTGYIARTDERQGEFDFAAPYMQGRFVLGAQYYQEFKEKNFVLVKAAFIGFVNEFTSSQFEPRMEDVYIMVGQKWWDVQIGRYLAWEVYYRGQGIELFTAEEAGAAGGPPIYWLQVTRGYRDESGQMAVHGYPWGADCQGARRYMGLCRGTFGIEVSSVYGQENNQNNWGVRPAIDLQYRGLQLMAGYEYLKLSPQDDASPAESKFHGWAARLQYARDLFSIGAEYSWSKRDQTNPLDEPDPTGTVDPWMTLGGYLNFRKGIHWPGIGYHYTSEKNLRGETRTQSQGFASYLIKLPVKGLALKFVYGFGVADLQDIRIPAEFHNVMHSGRVRIVYDPLGTLNRQDYP